jgi:uncharacterized protein YecE (DUF72 family)
MADKHTEPMIFLGCAGWSIPSTVRDQFAAEGSQLERYASVLPAVEINSSFYRPHRPATYERWRDSVPAQFRFSVKVPKEITHVLRLQHAEEQLARFLDEAMHLEEKLGCLLVQLPPSLVFDHAAVDSFFSLLRRRADMTLACEARHLSWFGDKAASVLREHEVITVIADPQVAPIPDTRHAGHTVYIRLHGSPRMYYSDYSDADLDRIAADIEGHADAGRHVWCVFDNTAEGAAQPNALSLLARLQKRMPVPMAPVMPAQAASPAQLSLPMSYR